VSDNWVLRGIFGPERREMVKCWSKLHKEELHNLYSSPSLIRIKSKRMRWVGYLARMEENKNACMILGEKPDGKRPLRIPRYS
jgi:hypothetical protein